MRVFWTPAAAWAMGSTVAHVDRAGPGRWMGRHPAVCAVIMAIAVGAGPTVQLATSPSVGGSVLTGVAVVGGAGFGLLFSLLARTSRGP